VDEGQQLVSWIGVLLLLLVLWQVYREQLKAILFNSPTTSSGGTNLTQAAASALGNDISNPFIAIP
jgi:hypothetical protein